MQPRGIHHVAINVSDVPESVAFYTGVLGGTLRTDRPEFGFAGAWIDLGGQQVHLLEAPVPRNLGQHLAVAFDDLDAVVGELRGRGIEVADPVPSGSGRQTFIDDPSGNAVELHQPATPAG
jgi:catechol 2,3-dioxygenase-like lactoylglutathione lyase family enzyme